MTPNDQPMDAAAPEGDSPESYKPADRQPYAMEQLIMEVEQCFPGTIYEVSNRTPRGVALDVQFVPSPDEYEEFKHLMSLLDDPDHNRDPRIQEILVDQEGVLVSFANVVALMDMRVSFGLVSALMILRGESR